MGKMKQFGMELARMVYIRRMSDDQIVNQYMNKSPKPPEGWLREQIQAVRKNPGMWRELANRS